MSRKDIVCINCPRGCRMTVESNNHKIEGISGYQCAKGKKYAEEEFLNPTRVLPTTVRVKNGDLPLAAVKTAAPIPRDLLLPAMKETAGIEVEAPVEIGQVIRKNLLNTGVNLVATGRVAKRDEEQLFRKLSV